jgi:hypothetical protein
MSDKAKKETIYSNHFYPFLDGAASKWLGRRIVPYSRCYADAFSVFTETKKQAIEDRQKRMELYIAVGMLAGTALCGLGPVAGILSAGSRGLMWKVANLSRAMGRMGIANQVAAWKVMSTFTFKALPAVGKLWWSERGKAILKDSLSKMGGVVQPGAGGSSITPVREGTSRDKLPLEYYLDLEGLILKAKNALIDNFEKMILDSAISVTEFETWCDHHRKANFIAKAPTDEFSQNDLNKIANEMELALWTQAALSWKYIGRKHNNSFTEGEGYHNAVMYADFLEEDRILERVDKVAKALGIKGYDYALYDFSQNKKGETMLRSHTTGRVKQAWDDHFGRWHSDEEKDRFCGWAYAYVQQKADLVGVPDELQGL